MQYFSTVRHYILLLIINDQIFANALNVSRVSSVTVDFSVKSTTGYSIGGRAPTKVLIQSPDNFKYVQSLTQ